MGEDSRFSTFVCPHPGWYLLARGVPTLATSRQWVTYPSQGAQGRHSPVKVGTPGQVRVVGPQGRYSPGQGRYPPARSGCGEVPKLGTPLAKVRTPCQVRMGVPQGRYPPGQGRYPPPRTCYTVDSRTFLCNPWFWRILILNLYFQMELGGTEAG